MAHELRDILKQLDIDDDALQIIVRYRPDLAGKTLDECRVILRAEYLGKRRGTQQDGRE
jgi:hypothetical protein